MDVIYTCGLEHGMHGRHSKYFGLFLGFRHSNAPIPSLHQFFLENHQAFHVSGRRYRLFQSHWLLMKDVGWLGWPNHNIVTSRVLVHDTHLACQNLKLQLPPQIQPLRPRLDGTCILDGSKMSHKFIFRDVPLRGEIRQNRSDMYFLKSCISYRQCRIFAYQTQTQKPQHFTYASGRSTQMGGEKENHVLGSISHSS